MNEINIYLISKTSPAFKLKQQFEMKDIALNQKIKHVFKCKYFIQLHIVINLNSLILFLKQ